MKHAFVPLLATAALALATAPDPVELAAKQICSANTPQVKTLNSLVRAPVLFCMWYRGNNDKGLPSPFSKLKLNDLGAACMCVLSNPRLGKTTLPAVTGTSTVKNLIDLENDFAQPLPLCKYWLAMSSKNASPFIDIAPSELTPLCKEITTNPKLLTTTRASSTKKGSSTKARSSTKAAPSSAKTSKDAGKTSASTKKSSAVTSTAHASAGTSKAAIASSTTTAATAKFSPSWPMLNTTHPATTAQKTSAKTTVTLKTSAKPAAKIAAFYSAGATDADSEGDDDGSDATSPDATKPTPDPNSDGDNSDN